MKGFGKNFIVLLMIVLSIFNTQSFGQLSSTFYDSSCPNVSSVVEGAVQQAVNAEARMAASLLRLFFHDCFVQGCDASDLLDDTASFTGEKTARPNNNSLRGFDVVDNIKTAVENVCPGVVSCADILALAALHSVVLSGGPSWTVLLGRRDSTTASLSLANSNLPSPNSDVNTLETKFSNQGLSTQDMVALSGAHTIGQARCTVFRSRLYNFNSTGQPDPDIDPAYLTSLQAQCPSSSGDDNLSPLDVTSPTTFDNAYYTNLENNKGLLTSDQVLFSTSGSTKKLVTTYQSDSTTFFNDFTTAMINMGNINPLTGSNGEIRANCHVVNS